jgi:gamma-glutamylcyclotransferase (GGCT)/AIG2-like uncharacterized protein YtfP
MAFALSGTPPLLFVYGTLRRGGSNDIARLVPTARFETAARLRGILYHLGEYPALVADSAASWVTGEVYRIAPEGWPALDALEHVVTDVRPDGEYFRVHTDVEAADGAMLCCQVYVANPARMRLDRAIEGGDWIAFAAAQAARR